MTRSIKPILSFLSVLLAVGFEPAGAANAKVTPDAVYRSGDFVRAAKLFEAAERENPMDARTHYMLGNVYSRLHQDGEALKEYESANELDRTGEIARYSQMALSAMHQATARQAELKAAEERQAKARAKAQAEEEARLNAQCDQEIARISRDAEDQVAKITQEMNDRIAANGVPTYASTYGAMTNTPYYDPAPLNEEVKRECNLRIEQVRKQAKYRADAVTKGYKDRISALQSSTSYRKSASISGVPGSVATPSSPSAPSEPPPRR